MSELWRGSFRGVLTPPQLFTAVLPSGGLTLTALLALVVLALVFAFQQTHMAEALRGEMQHVQDALTEADQQRRTAQESEARLSLEKGLTLCEQGEAGVGLLWLARGLQIAHQANAADVEWAIRVNLAHWYHRLNVLTESDEYTGKGASIAFAPDSHDFLIASSTGSLESPHRCSVGMRQADKRWDQRSRISSLFTAWRLGQTVGPPGFTAPTVCSRTGMYAREPSLASPGRPHQRQRNTQVDSECRLAPATLTVNTTADNTTDTTVLTLRDAITLVNNGASPSSLGQSSIPAGWASQIDTSNPFSTADTIVFDITAASPITLGQLTLVRRVQPTECHAGTPSRATTMPMTALRCRSKVTSPKKKAGLDLTRLPPNWHVAW